MTAQNPVVQIADENLAKETPLCASCQEEPRQAHCIYCPACEVYFLVTKDHRDPNTISSEKDC